MSSAKEVHQSWTSPEGVPFREVPGGSFEMGSSDGFEDEQPVHPVSVDSFWMSRTPITQGQWVNVMGSNPSHPRLSRGVSIPVNLVSWNDAIWFCYMLSIKEGRTPFYFLDDQNIVGIDKEADGYRLPTEAEWEYAARGGPESRGAVYAGSDNIDEVGWYDLNSDVVTPRVERKMPNELGLYDMSGNVFEWCWDKYGPYPKETQANPTGAVSGSYRVRRGGSWSFCYYDCTVSSRGCNLPNSHLYDNGLRVVLLNPLQGDDVEM